MDSTSGYPAYGELSREEKEIRLLKIKPASHASAPFECTVHVFPIEHAPPYDALSYVWGDPKVTKEILLDGSSVQVTVNLHAALLTVRKRRDADMLWVDAICINQKITKERNHQVSMMGLIYQSARRTLSWLGECDEPAHCAFYFLSLCSKIISAATSMSREEELRMMNSCFRVFDLIVGHNREGQNLTSGLWSRPYWKRIWIIQEVLLARECVILCGPHTILFRDLIEFYDAWILLVKNFPSRAPRIVHLGLLFNPFEEILSLASNNINTRSVPLSPLEAGTGSNVFLWKLVKATWQFGATNPRDNIYGLLGLLNTETPFQPNYEHSTTDVYADLAWKVIQDSAKLDILVHEKGVRFLPKEETHPLSLPSWVPNLESLRDPCEFEPDLFAAAGEETSFSEISVHDRSLKVHVIFCDEVLDIDSVSWAATKWQLCNESPHIDLSERLVRIHLWASCRRGKITKYKQHWRAILYQTMEAFQYVHVQFNDARDLVHTTAVQVERTRLGKKLVHIIEDMMTLFTDIAELGKTWEALLEDIIGPSNPTESSYWRSWVEDVNDRARFKDRLRDDILGVPHFTNKDDDRGGVHDPINVSLENALNRSDYVNLDKMVYDEPEFIRDRIRLSWVLRRIFITKKGYLGRGVQEMRPGDKITVVMGCSMPLLLRPKGNGNYELMGHAYVHGMMYGEMIEEMRNGNLELEEIVLE